MFHHQQHQQQQQQQQQQQESHVMPSLLFSPPGSSGARSARHASVASGGTSGGGGRVRKTKLFLDFQDVGNGAEAEKNVSPTPDRGGFDTMARSANKPFQQEEQQQQQQRRLQEHVHQRQHAGTAAGTSPSPSPPSAGHTLRADIDKEQDWTPPMATWGDELMETADFVMGRDGGGGAGGDEYVAGKPHEANDTAGNDGGRAGGDLGDAMPQSSYAYESRDVDADVWSIHRPQPSNSWTSALARIVFGSGI